ncbi:uncharacterized protein LOC135169498 isoform X2 [Diachasmimorpha longicaudata]|uniref:uncharacterized protein LOC135169498 isoform X2 n=1 Tax=Diachasmimorpha longicaudata TaxID=58733 RepID=UPI0030B8F139
MGLRAFRVSRTPPGVSSPGNYEKRPTGIVQCPIYKVEGKRWCGGGVYIVDVMCHLRRCILLDKREGPVNGLVDRADDRMAQMPGEKSNFLILRTSPFLKHKSIDKLLS